MPIHVADMLVMSELPVECIKDCAASGDVSEAVEFWRRELRFTVDRAKAVKCLAGYGAWNDDELAAMSDDDLADRILWIACGNFNDFMVCGENAGSDIFTLEN